LGYCRCFLFLFESKLIQSSTLRTSARTISGHEFTELCNRRTLLAAASCPRDILFNGQNEDGRDDMKVQANMGTGRKKRVQVRRRPQHNVAALANANSRRVKQCGGKKANIHGQSSIYINRQQTEPSASQTSHLCPPSTSPILPGSIIHSTEGGHDNERHLHKSQHTTSEWGTYTCLHEKTTAVDLH
jgi:hypothetical protein